MWCRTGVGGLVGKAMAKLGRIMTYGSGPGAMVLKMMLRITGELVAEVLGILHKHPEGLVSRASVVVDFSWRHPESLYSRT